MCLLYFYHLAGTLAKRAKTNFNSRPKARSKKSLKFASLTCIINTNALEFDHSVPIPDFSYMKRQYEQFPAVEIQGHPLSASSKHE